MSYDDVWEYGPDEPLVRHGEFRLTVVGPPFPGGDGELPAHDPARAAGLVAALGAVDAVVGEDGRIEAVERPPFATRADLDLVAVGCWGPVSEVNDPALAAGGDGSALAEQADALAARYPGAAVIGSVRVDHPVAYGAHVVQHPDGARLFAAGWAGEGDWDLEGGVAEVAGAFGIDADALRDAGVDPDAEPGDLAWESLTRLVLRRTSPLHRVGRTLSVFRVRRSEGTAGDLEDTWIGEPDGF
ncbi:DUF6333 family protein [Streptomyces sp. NPDC048213]|uniref:DUF6333 family protein n=1 Tax=Streptomyces sp. NPDC048213 TaxID=3160984 RepID=UPI0033F9BA9D